MGGSKFEDVLETEAHDLIPEFYAAFGRLTFVFQYTEHLVGQLQLFLDHFHGTLKTPEQHQKRTNYLDQKATIGKLVPDLFKNLPHFNGIHDLEFKLDVVVDRRNNLIHHSVDEIWLYKHDELFVSKKIEELRTYHRETTELNSSLRDLVNEYYAKPEVQEDLARWHKFFWGWSEPPEESSDQVDRSF